MALDPKNLLPGQEQFENFTRRNKEYYQYDYRHYNGELFSCVSTSLQKARFDRDMWLRKNNEYEYPPGTDIPDDEEAEDEVEV